jgi:hypothetical protein
MANGISSEDDHTECSKYADIFSLTSLVILYVCIGVGVWLATKLSRGNDGLRVLYAAAQGSPVVFINSF